MNHSLKLVILIISIVTGVMSAQSDIQASRLDQPLTVDGILDENLYRNPAFNYFIQTEPDNGSPATEQTEVWVGFDDAALYVGWRLWDSNPEEIVSRMARRDGDFNSDEVQFAIDSYDDDRSGFYFIVNPAGSIQDGTIANDGWFDDTWDGIWEQAARIDDQGWTVEMRIPFSQLRFNNRAETVMGLGLGRLIKRKNEHDLSFADPRGEPGIVSKFGDLRGIKNIKPPRRVELIPYTMANYSDLPSKEDNPFYQGRDRQAGIGTDLKLGIGNNLTLDATINPDFGQVEVDPSVINLSDHETYYDEKRPFFVEGASIFSFGSGGPTNRSNFNYASPEFFYSRRIGRPPQGDVDSDGWVKSPSTTRIIGAGKISGKLPGDLSIGGLSAVTHREFAEIDEDSVTFDQEVEPLTSYNLLRGQKEFQSGRHGIGGIVSYLNRGFDDRRLRSTLTDQAIGIAVDGWTFFNQSRQWALAWWGGYSRVDGSPTKLTDIQESYNHYFQKPGVSHIEVDPELTRLEGWAGRLFLNKEKGRLRMNTSLGFTSPGFESNDMGINFKSDQINKHLMVLYNWFEPGSFYRSAHLWTAAMSNHNFGGDKINNMYFLSGSIELLNYHSLRFMTGAGPRTIDDGKLRGGPMVASPAGFFSNIGWHSDGRKPLVYELDIEGGRGENGYWHYEVDPEILVKVSGQLSFRFNPEFYASRSVAQYVMTVDDPAATHMYGKRYILATLDRQTFESSLRIDYTMTPKLTLQAYFQALLAVGKYSDYKEFARPRSLDYIHYNQAGLEIRYDESNDEYYVVQTNDPVQHQTDDNFNYKSLVGSMVLRWELRPGSILYVVWTLNGENEEHPGDFALARDLNDLFTARRDQVLALKLTWWLGR